jgi:hypothetical protein
LLCSQYFGFRAPASGSLNKPRTLPKNPNSLGNSWAKRSRNVRIVRMPADDAARADYLDELRATGKCFS